MIDAERRTVCLVATPTVAAVSGKQFMYRDVESVHRRILVIDDNPAIHEDYRKILLSTLPRAPALAECAAALLGAPPDATTLPEYQIDSALQGAEGVALVRRARDENRPYALAFVDARMPPGWDGIETAARMWQHDPDIQIVICTAYSDYSWQELRRKLVYADRLIILKKPFDDIEVLQLADALTEKWRLACEDRRRLRDLECRINEHMRDLNTSESIDAQLAAADGKAAETEVSSAPDNPALRRRALEFGLRQALLARELTIHYQPLVDIASRRVVSLEALLRWQHPTLGSVSPGEFIPIAEASGLIVPIGEWVLASVCEQIARWERQNVPVVPVAVNLSAVQLARQDVWELVRGILRRTRIQPHQLALEITETTFIQHLQQHVLTLQQLRGAGVRIQIDDFGTGYSSLSYLQHLPIDTLKIDRIFIKQLDTRSTDEAIVSAILAMSRSLRLGVVAEGVETPAQLEVLARHGCEVAQGYYFCRPLPAEQCQGLLFDLAQRSSFTDTLRLRLASNTSDTVGLTPLRKVQQ